MSTIIDNSLNSVIFSSILISDGNSYESGSNYVTITQITGSDANVLQFKPYYTDITSSNELLSARLQIDSILSGINPTASAPGAATFGINNIATNTGSFVEGVGTLASGFAAHAAGFNTTASGYAAFSVGVETDADGTASFAAGSGSWARGTATVAMGIGTVASSSGQVTIGHFNFPLNSPDHLFVVGGGTADTPSNRGNLLEVYGGIGAPHRAVKIDVQSTSSNWDRSINPGLSIFGNTTFQGNITGSTRVGGSNIIIYDDTFNGINSTSSFYVVDTDRVAYTNGDLAKIGINRFGINFELSNNANSPGVTYLWTNPLGLLYYGSNAIILNNGNTLGTTMTIGTTDANNLQLETNNSTRLFISSSGNVGIGTITPTLATLQIQGNVSASSYTGSLFGTSSWAVNALTASFVNTASTNAFVQGGNSFGTTALLGTNDNQNLQFETSGSVRVTISSSGNVGIGITTPSASLHINGSTILSGSLYTYNANTDIDSGSFRTIITVATSSYQAAFFDYVLTSGSNARAGTVFSVWQGTSVEYADTSTNDIGNTNGVNLLVSMSGANIGLFASSSNDNWSMKALARLL